MTNRLQDTTGTPRIAGLDFLRGCAVLGILAINITGFWGPSLASYSPHLPVHDGAGVPWFAFAFVVFEGKMRALFTLLFGASMVLFIETAERRGANGDLMQARRLLWLAVFGYAHYLLLWWGDILFPYALCGLCALLLRRLAPAGLAAIGLFVFTAAHGLESLAAIPGVMGEQHVLSGTAAPAQTAEQALMMARIAQSIADDTRVLQAPFAEAVRLRFTQAPFEPFATARLTFTETLPLMLIGMALYRSGFFTGGWSHATLRRLTVCGIAGGGALTLALLAWLIPHQFPPRAMFATLNDWTALPHLAMALGYGAGLVLLWPRVAASGPGQRLAAAGRCAFSNYLGTTLLMSALFCGWGLNLGATLPRVWLPAFAALGWAAMLAWPRWWLARFGQGPLEALWRKLTWLGVKRAA